MRLKKDIQTHYGNDNLVQFLLIIIENNVAVK